MILHSTHHINIQVQSFGKYLQDIWILALIFVLFQNDTTIALPFIWIGLQFVIAIAAQLIFHKTGPNSLVPFILPSFILLFLFLFGSPVWLFVLGVIISIWRIQERFNTMQNEQGNDSFFTLLFFATFLVVHYINFLMGYEGYHSILYTVFVTGIALFVGIRLFSVWINTDKHNSITLGKGLGIYLISLVSVASFTVFIYFIAPVVRKMMDVLFVAIMRVVVIPFAPLLEYLENLMNGLQIRELEEDTRIPVGEQAKIKPNKIGSEETFLNFPVEWIVYGLATIVILFFVRYLLKSKPEKLEVERINFRNETNQLINLEENQQSQQSSLYKVESSLLREKYLQFELEAQRFKLDRNKSETVREWFKRMDWLVEDKFFYIYEEVRYGGQLIETTKADMFIKNLEEIKKYNFVEKNV
ncbi:hypothetical protein MHH81_04925 [Psychrobacillus sp. FSL H8-0484]|uniref:hypothetical protein n=1 Tax=Psychrobacillus sp. FSL H8-0484 TaxID=2921390 RepID=UPI0030FAD6DD